MKAITIKQPWASLIALGKKKIETRSWQTKFRGPILIHAGKSIDKEAFEEEPIKTILANRGIIKPEDLPTGCIIAKANLKEVYKIDYYNDYSKKAEGWNVSKANDRLLVDRLEYELGGYIFDENNSRYGWKLLDVTPIKPIYCKGQLGLWNYEGSEIDNEV